MCDTDAARAETVAKAHGTRAISNYRELIGEVDAVAVVVPTRAHFAVAKDFLEAGVDVLLEKPMCETLAQADGLIALAREKGRILQVGHLERFSPLIQALAGIVKKPGYIETHRISRFHGRGTDTTVILDMMIHDIDHLLQIVGAPIVQIDAVGVPVLSDAEDIANARIRFENGCVATVTASRVSWKVKRTLRLFQPDADATTHDLLLVSHPVFLFPDVATYAEGFSAIAEGRALGFCPGDLRGAISVPVPLASPRVEEVASSRTTEQPARGSRQHPVGVRIGAAGEALGRSSIRAIRKVSELRFSRVGTRAPG